MNFKKRRYIKNKWLVSLLLFITGVNQRNCYVMGRGIAYLRYIESGDVSNFSDYWSRKYLSSFWQMVVWALLITTYQRPIITFAGLIFIPFIPASLIMRLF